MVAPISPSAPGQQKLPFAISCHLNCCCRPESLSDSHSQFHFDSDSFGVFSWFR